MRAKEFITEKIELKQHQKDAIPNGDVYPDSNNNFYTLYRLGLAMATAPDSTVEKDGVLGLNIATIAYSDADQKIIDCATKNLGLKPEAFAKGPSKEHDSIHKQSPVPTKKKNKYGI